MKSSNNCKLSRLLTVSKNNKLYKNLLELSRLEKECVTSSIFSVSIQIKFKYPLFYISDNMYELEYLSENNSDMNLYTHSIFDFKTSRIL